MGRLTVHQVGDRLVLSFPRPTARTGGEPLAPDARLELLMSLRDPEPRRPREIEADPSLAWTIAATEWKSYEQGRRLEVGLSLGRIAQVLDFPGGAAALKGRKLSFIAEVIDNRRQRSDPSDIETFVVCDPPAAPDGSAGRITEQGVLLTWLSTWSAPPAGSRFNVYRQEVGGILPEGPLHTDGPEARSWLDTEAVIDRPYRYIIRAAAASGRCESAGGPIVEAVRVDLFPPAPPQGLAAVAEQGAIRLFWRPNRDLDLHGYRVYRADGPEAPFRLLTPAELSTTSFTDEDVAPGVVYSYAVTALDGANPANESAFSDQADEAMNDGRKDAKP